MMWDEARNAIQEWHARHPKEDLCSKSGAGDARLTFVGKRAAKQLQPYDLEEVLDAMSEVELGTGYSKFGKVLALLRSIKKDGGNRWTDWQNGDIVDCQGHVGWINRDGDYAQFLVPVDGNGVACVQDGSSLPGAVRALGDQDAERFMREWWPRLGVGRRYMGLHAAHERLSQTS